MGLLNSLSREQRAVSVENPAVSLSDPAALSLLFGSFASAAGVEVSVERALSVPAIWCAVNFLAGTIASLPLFMYRREGDDAVMQAGPLGSMLEGVVNEDYLTSYKWRYGAMVQTLTRGRSYTYAKRNASFAIANLWPLDADSMRVGRKSARTVYSYRDGGGDLTYSAPDIIDLPFFVEINNIARRDPVQQLRNAIGLAIAVEEYASRFFQNGGVPPLALQTSAASPGAVTRAADATWEAVQQSRRDNRNVLVLPQGDKLVPVGFEPSKQQMVDVRRFQIEEVARCYMLPPSFLQDLTHGTFSNVEQQDLNFVKHTLRRWVRLWESELNAKLFSRRNTQLFVRFNLDDLERGDFKSRMEAWAAGVQGAVVKPNEARRVEHLPADPSGNQLMINGASVPIAQAGQKPQPGNPEPKKEPTP
ncbi:phage portal protein [Bradyrhizobium sp. USDA 4452]